MANIRVATNLLDSPAHSGPGKFGRLLAKYIAPLGVDLLPSHALTKGAHAYLASALINENLLNYAKGHEIPILLRLDGVGEIFPYKTYNADFPRVKFAHANADHVIYQSEFARNYVQETTKFFPENSSVILNGIEVRPPIFRSLQHVPTKFISVCNNWSQFRYHIFKEAVLHHYDAITHFFPQWRWTIIGKHDEFKALVGKKEHIHFVEFTQDLDALRTQSHAVIHLVGKDSCPNSLMESMSYSLPAVVWHESGGPEIAGAGGVTLMNTNKDSILNAFKYIEENYDRMSGEAYKSIMSQCDILDTAAKYKKVILEAIRGQNSDSGIHIQSH